MNVNMLKPEAPILLSLTASRLTPRISGAAQVISQVETRIKARLKSNHPAARFGAKAKMEIVLMMSRAWTFLLPMSPANHVVGLSQFPLSIRERIDKENEQG